MQGVVWRRGPRHAPPGPIDYAERELNQSESGPESAQSFDTGKGTSPVTGGQDVGILPDGAMRKPHAGLAGDERAGCAVARPSCQDVPLAIASEG